MSKRCLPLAFAASGDETVSRHFALTTMSEIVMMAKRATLPDSWSVPPQLRERLGQQVGRQRAMAAEGHLLLVLHAPPKPDQRDRVGRFFWRDPEGNWFSNDFGSGRGVVMRHIDEYAAQLARVEQLDREADSAEDYHRIMTLLAPFQRAARNSHQALQQARELCGEAVELIDSRDCAYEIERTAELLYIDAKNSMEYAMAVHTEDQAELNLKMAASAHRLNLVVGFFLPLATLAAVFGMNVEHGFERIPGPIAFMSVVAGGLVMGVVMITALSARIKTPTPVRRVGAPATVRENSGRVRR